MKFSFYDADFKSSFLIEGILKEKLTGIVVENSLKNEEIRIFKNCVEQLKERFFHDLNTGNGFSLPGMFGQLHKTQPKHLIESYFENIEPFCSAVNLVCGFNVQQRLTQLLRLYFQPHTAAVLPGFLPYSFRVVYPKKGGLFVHKDGQLLPFIHNEVSEVICRYVQPETMMSWYFTLQDPDEGGELWVADTLYDDYVKEGQFAMVNSQGERIEVDAMQHIKVKPPTGSLLMFKGGSYWHKVVPPADNAENRITFGGFMALGLDEQYVYYWS